MRRVIACAGTAAALVLSPMPDADAAVYQPDASVAGLTGPAVGDGVYSSTATGEIFFVKKKRGKTAHMRMFAAQAGTSPTDQFKLTGCVSAPGSVVKCYDSDHFDITSDLTGAGYQYDQTGMSSREFFMDIKVKKHAPKVITVFFNVHSNPGNIDDKIAVHVDVKN